MTHEKARIYFTYLFNGYETTFKQWTIKLFKKGDAVSMPSGEYEATEFWLGCKVTTGEGHTKWVGLDLPLVDVLNYADTLSDDEILRQCANITLTDANKRKRRGE